MSSVIVDWLTNSGSFAIIISILINVVISVAGVIPSVFITAANITVFGFGIGLVISFLGECIGALVSFWLYRKGIQRLNPKLLKKNKWLVKLQHTHGKDAFVIIIMLRILPFVPSGMINLAAALSKTSITVFFIASSLGKLPALFIEAYSVQHVLESTMRENIILAVIAFVIFIVFYIVRKRNQSK
ncbi:DedA family protein [Peribacillus saganii]|uniref:TVP38/TMEM64 family membrane protein n=1 Tax=Peribacillus saganii TaxID=2303992 RepID=A0A372LLZ3_9BACI|nr:VTT domain-containing protein [Peribacillus saganii]RFU67491.1 DedA family protein [Peribacillus saganii]